MWHWLLRDNPVMYALLGCSVIALTFVIERLIYWVRRRLRRDPKRMEQVLSQLEAARHAQAQRLCAESSDPELQVLGAGLNHPHESLTSALQAAAGAESRRMRRFLRVLDTIVTVAPLLGILGTILGIITSFEVLGASGVENPLEVTGGIADALVTTAAGLVLAIATLIPYNYFAAKAEETTLELETRLSNFEALADTAHEPDETARED